MSQVAGSGALEGGQSQEVTGISWNADLGRGPCGWKRKGSEDTGAGTNLRGDSKLCSWLHAWPWVNPPPEKSARSPYPADELWVGPRLQKLSL